MALLSLFDEPTAVRGVVACDLGGRPLEPSAGPLALTETHGAAAAAAVREFAAAGEALGFSSVEEIAVKAPDRAVLTAIHPEGMLLAVVDPSNGTAAFEKALRAWPSTGRPPPLPARSAGSSPAPEVLGSMTPPPIPLTRSPASNGATPARRLAPAESRWAGLRRSLVRGQLTQAVALQRELRDAPPAASPEAGAEPLSGEDQDRLMRILVDGVGSVMAGDGVAGGRILQRLATDSQPNLSFRWLALHWGGLAALRNGEPGAARPLVKESLAIAKRLGAGAQAVSQWAAAELLARGADPAQALPWLKSARILFGRLGDAWGTGRSWMTEARILLALKRDDECVHAAQQAWTADPSWDEPPLFLARRALQREDLAGAESFARAVETPAASRFRAVVEGVRRGALSQADASALLQEEEGPPSVRALRVLERIAAASPEFVQAREALAWMLVRLGKYESAETAFRELLSGQLDPGERNSVLLGLDCIAQARRLAAERAPAASPAGPASGSAPASTASSSAVLGRGAAPGSAAPGAVFSGRLSAFALPDLVEFLRGARRTGLLVCRSSAGMGALRFRNGRVTGGTSPGTPRVGEMLLRNRKISPVALRALPATDGEDSTVAAMLVREGAADAAAVQESLRQQIEMAMRELFDWKDGEFVFDHEADGPELPAAVAVELDPQAVLLGLLKDLDEASRTAASGGAR